MVEKEVIVKNTLGIHARPATQFVKIASKYSCEVYVIKDGIEVNGKSIMSLLILTATKGSKLTIRCSGPDEEKALKELVDLVEGGFGED
ncbi:MAG: HPr family phosphocarrier protein [Candidatus Hydrothermales bacterium]